jgi:ParB-like chromosome segregation protein Spo0J
MKKDNENNREVIDGFHRNRIAKESMIIKSRLFGYSPVVTIRDTQIDRSNRIAATIRHNRA